MKDFVRIKGKIEEFSAKELVFASVMHFLAFLGGVISTRAVVLGTLLPFGISYLAATPGVFMPAVAFGTFSGYFFPVVGASGFRYIATLFAILAIKLLLGNYKKIIKNPVFLGMISFFASLLTTAVNFKNGSTNILDGLTESLLAAFGGYFLTKGFSVLDGSYNGLSNEELSSLLISLCIVFMGLNGFETGGISLGRILSVILILVAAKLGGITAGSISGVAVGLCTCFSSVGPFIGMGLAFSGLMAGVFSMLGKYVQGIILLIFVFIGGAASGNLNLLAIAIIEALAGSLLFVLIPKRLNDLLSRVFSARTLLTIPEGFKKSLTLRLELASNALKDVSKTVEQVSGELAKINSPDFENVITAVEQDACAGCKLRVHCWETKRDDTIEAVINMTKAVKQGEFAPEGEATTEFKGRCLRLAKIGNATYRRYSDYAGRIAAENRIDEVRSVVSDQFSGISSMLYELSLDFKNDEQFDTAAAEASASALASIGIHIDEASARIDKYGRMTLEFKLKRSKDLVINKMHIIRALSIACERDFDTPIVTELGSEVFILVNERADITVDFAAEQMCSAKSTMCGDAYKSFYDGKGHFIIVLSDGMGTGGRAAVDGAMASGLMSRLIKSGFGYDCSLKILNSSMLFKSTDESLATLDIASIDLFTGVLELYKAGAAPTIVRRQGKVGKAESTSLPAGILKDISFDKMNIRCRIGDVIVLMSDGVSSTGTDWIRAELEAFSEGDAKSLARRICEGAKRRSDTTHQDDLSVLVAILEKSI